MTTANTYTHMRAHTQKEKKRNSVEGIILKVIKIHSKVYQYKGNTL